MTYYYYKKKYKKKIIVLSSLLNEPLVLNHLFIKSKSINRTKMCSVCWTKPLPTDYRYKNQKSKGKKSTQRKIENILFLESSQPPKAVLF